MTATDRYPVKVARYTQGLARELSAWSKFRPLEMAATTAATAQSRDFASTRFDDVACASLASGDTLTIEGLRQPDGSVRASEIKRTSGGSPGGDDSDKDDNGSNNRGSGSGNSGSGSNGGGDDRKGK